MISVKKVNKKNEIKFVPLPVITDEDIDNSKEVENETDNSGIINFFNNLASDGKTINEAINELLGTIGKSVGNGPMVEQAYKEFVLIPASKAGIKLKVETKKGDRIHALIEKYNSVTSKGGDELKEDTYNEGMGDDEAEESENDEEYDFEKF